MGPITAGSDHTACMASKPAGMKGRMISRPVMMGKGTLGVLAPALVGGARGKAALNQAQKT
jgi:hypothetical protein